MVKQWIVDRVGRRPAAVTPNRGYGYASVEADLHATWGPHSGDPVGQQARRNTAGSSNTEKRSGPRSNNTADTKAPREQADRQHPADLGNTH